MRFGMDELMKRFKRAVSSHQLIDDEQPILVGLSGGKDSILLLHALHLFLPVSKYKYRLAAGHVALGFAGEDSRPLAAYCESLGIPFFEEKSNIAEIVFEARKESSPCSLCAKMRRGALNSLAKKHGFNKIALGHHQDDVLETLLLRTFFEGRIGSFNPRTYLDRMDITVIRPFVYVPEDLIRYCVEKLNLPVTQSCCPANGYTKREDMKDIVRKIASLTPHARDRASHALDACFGLRWDGKKEEEQ